MTQKKDSTQNTCKWGLIHRGRLVELVVNTDESFQQGPIVEPRVTRFTTRDLELVGQIRSNGIRIGLQYTCIQGTFMFLEDHEQCSRFDTEYVRAVGADYVCLVHLSNILPRTVPKAKDKPSARQYLRTIDDTICAYRIG